MKHRVRLRIAIVWAGCVSISAATSGQTTLEKRLEAALGSAAGAQAAVLVHTLDCGPVFEHDADVPLKPASVLKLFTTSAALHRFGTNLTLDTTVFQAGDELWVLGGGDPGLGDERLEQRAGQTNTAVFDRWAALLKQRGVTQLTNIVLDDFVFDDEPRHPTWEADQYLAWYQAPVGGLNFNDNCVDLRIEPGGNTPRLIVIPPLPDEFVITELRSGRKHGVTARRPAESDLFEIRGSVARAEDLGSLAVRRPNVFFGQALRQGLESRGIVVRGEVVRRRLAGRLAEAKLVDVHSTSLRDLIWRANTFSQNLFAECLCKALAAYGPDGQRSGEAGSWAAGTAMMRTTLTAAGVDLRGAEIVDGSGLSHENRVTARQIVTLLEVEHRAAHAQAFIDSLAVAGEDGTLRRYRSAPFVGKLRAKTGTIANVHTMAGYFDAPNGATYVFAALGNGKNAGNLAERVVSALAGP